MNILPKTLSSDAYHQIEELIVTLELPPGKLISEHELSSKLGLGRTPVREALQRLDWEGLVLIMPRRGILVSEIDYGRQMLALEVRRELERLMAQKACVRATQSEREAFLVIGEEMKLSVHHNDGIAFMRHDRTLNELMASASHNEYASRASRIWNGLSRRFWYVHYQKAADLSVISDLHVDLAKHISHGDTTAAANACDHLNDYVLDFTKAAFNFD